MKRIRVFFEGFHYQVNPDGKVYACAGQLMNDPLPKRPRFTELVIDKRWASLIKAEARKAARRKVR